MEAYEKGDMHIKYDNIPLIFAHNLHIIKTAKTTRKGRKHHENSSMGSFAGGGTGCSFSVRRLWAVGHKQRTDLELELRSVHLQRQAADCCQLEELCSIYEQETGVRIKTLTLDEPDALRTEMISSAPPAILTT